MNPLRRLAKGMLVHAICRLAASATVVVLCFLVPRTVSAGLIMRIDTASKTFFVEGSDTGNADYFQPEPFDPGSYSLQFIHYFSTTVPQSAIVTNNPQDFFVEATTLSMYGGMNMITNFGQNYVFMDLGSGSSDITSLTGKGPSAAASYAGLAAADISLFESLIGDSLILSAGTGYSPISVQAVPEPSTYAMALAGIACGGFSMWRRRKRA